MAASMLVAAYHIYGTEYRELGDAHFDRRNKRHVANRLVRRLTRLGYAADLRPAA